jgi:hypothetical protein
MTDQTITSYTLERKFGSVHIIDNEDGERAARVSRFSVGPQQSLVSVTGGGLHSAALARAIAEAMVIVADEIERGR